MNESFLAKKISALRYRAKCYSWGLFYGRTPSLVIPRKILFGLSAIEIKFSNRSDHRFRYEFLDICIHDAYQLNKFPVNEVHTVVDIGANQGIFLLAVRKHFSKAAIFAYEPNNNLENILSFNCSQLNVACFYEAVTAQDCKVSLQFTESDLETKVEQSQTGNVTGTSLKRVIERAGGKIDILKMDCEGGEWDLLQLNDEWKHVRYITMEYHLWHGKGHTIEELTAILQRKAFTVVYIKPVDALYGMLVAVNQNFNA